MSLVKSSIIVIAWLGVAGKVEAQQDSSVVDRIRRALSLPARAEEIRRAGVSAEEVRVVLDSARRRRIPASDTEAVLDESARAVREHGPVDNFGAFVNQQLSAGLRGRDLADAIRSEHQRRGIGKGKRLDGRDASGARDRLDSARRGGAPDGRRGRPEAGDRVEGVRDSLRDQARPGRGARRPERNAEGRADSLRRRGQGRRSVRDTIPNRGR